MNTVWKTIKKLDRVNQIVLISGIICALVFLILKKGYGSVLIVIGMGALMAARNRTEQKYYLRKYGYLYYMMPDGEVVQEPVSEINHQEKRFEGRTVSISFLFFGMENELIDTGLGIYVDPSAIENYTQPKRRQEVSATGTVNTKDGFWVIEKVSRFIIREKK